MTASHTQTMASTSDIEQSSTSSVLLGGSKVEWLGSAGRSLSVLLGVGVLVLAGIKAFTGWDVPQVLDVANAVFGPVFIGLYLALVAVALLAWSRGLNTWHAAEHDPWWEAGVQAANGIATLALTFTLLGISIGIGGLSGTPLTPETVPDVIATLTEQFGRAFMTTIVGLPTSNVLRALLSINATERRRRVAMAQQTEQQKPNTLAQTLAGALK